jgi:hypothetical protein
MPGALDEGGPLLHQVVTFQARRSTRLVVGDHGAGLAHRVSRIHLEDSRGRHSSYGLAASAWNRCTRWAGLTPRASTGPSFAWDFGRAGGIVASDGQASGMRAQRAEPPDRAGGAPLNARPRHRNRRGLTQRGRRLGSRDLDRTLQGAPYPPGKSSTSRRAGRRSRSGRQGRSRRRSGSGAHVVTHLGPSRALILRPALPRLVSLPRSERVTHTGWHPSSEARFVTQVGTRRAISIGILRPRLVSLPTWERVARLSSCRGAGRPTQAAAAALAAARAAA